MLDPIVSLSVGVAEASRSYAVLLGSGASRDAGVPTGGEVFWLAVEDLYRLEHRSGEKPSRDERHSLPSLTAASGRTRGYWSP